jgi:DNA polymerase-3 subunit delta'
MSFADFPDQQQVVTLLQRSLERGRLGHAYLFTGHDLSQLSALALKLAATLNCQNPVRRTPDGPPIDACGECIICRKINGDGHPDVHRVRPESKSRVITIDQMRELMQEIHLKANEAEYKVAIVEAVDRLNVQAANAFLKTLEEPPAKCVFILLTTEPQRILETIISRCLRLNFAGEGSAMFLQQHRDWLIQFAEAAAAGDKSLMGRYRLLGMLLKKLGEMHDSIESDMTAKSPLQRHDDIDPKLRERWEDELTAAVEAEYRLKRSELLVAVQSWLRDIWLSTLQVTANASDLVTLPATIAVARRINTIQATQNLATIERTQRLLYTNVQEALALEVGLLKLSF